MCQEITGIYEIYNPDYVYVRYPVIFSETVDSSRIDKIKLLVREKTGIVLGEWFNDVVHPKGSYRYGYEDHSCGVGESMARQIINLPINIHTAIDKKTIDKIKTIINYELIR